MIQTPVIEVLIWGRRVGAVALDPALGCYVFSYDPGWRRTGIELAPLTMPLSDRLNAFVFPNLPERTFHRLPAMLADALPDDFGNALIDAWMARHGVAKGEITVLDRFAYMGKRSMGALEFRPMIATGRERVSPLEMQVLVEEARKVIDGSLDSAEHAQTALHHLFQVGTSAGGARAKAVLAWNPETNQVRSGQFAAPEGFEYWLLKFDGVGKDFELGTGAEYGRIEYAYYRMALNAGISMSESRLLEENGRAHFMTRRFDRALEQGRVVKHHVQTLCAMAELDFRQAATHDYAQLFLVASRLGLGDAAMEQIFLRMAFNVMAANCDDHTKNFAFLLQEGGGWQLTPAYDVTHAHRPDGEWTYQHQMSVQGRFQGIDRADLLALAERFNVRRPERLLGQVREAMESWRTCAERAQLDPGIAQRVAADFRLL